eukprot:m.656964 g.656964  ORF g.656964 m.656964 type:complete len:236 (-) comp22709_c0_seq1:114-821(-)
MAAMADAENDVVSTGAGDCTAEDSASSLARAVSLSWWVVLPSLVPLAGAVAFREKKLLMHCSGFVGVFVHGSDTGGVAAAVGPMRARLCLSFKDDRLSSVSPMDPTGAPDSLEIFRLEILQDPTSFLQLSRKVQQYYMMMVLNDISQGKMQASPDIGYFTSFRFIRCSATRIVTVDRSIFWDHHAGSQIGEKTECIRCGAQNLIFQQCLWFRFTGPTATDSLQKSQSPSIGELVG